MATALAVAACGGSGPRQDAGEPSGNFPVQVSSATFPASQQLAQSSHLVIAVRNSGSATIPDIAVTITSAKYGTAAQSFGQLLAKPSAGQTILASRSRPIWIIDQPPGPCEFSCKQGGPGGAATSDSDTWALGRLAPGHTAKFAWAVTAVQTGAYTLHYRVAAGLSGKAKAVLSGNHPVEGSFRVSISSQPRQAEVTSSGQVVYSK